MNLEPPTDYLDELEMTRDGTIESSEFVGDPLEEVINDQRTRIYIQNLNGLNWDADGGKWSYVCEVLASINADIACFSELNTDTNRYTIRRKMENIAQQHFEQNHLIMATSKFETATCYKPGGTAILATNSVTSNIKSHTRDRMGRWTSLCFTTTTDRKIRIISAYQVCQNNRPGPNTAASHQMSQIMQEAINMNITSRPTPRQAFVNDLQAFILHCQSEQEAIILAGDFNEELNESSSGMGTLANRCGLADLFSTRIGTPNIPATYQRGTKRLDYLLLSPTLISTVEAAGYDPFGYRLPSDHRGMYVDFNTQALFGHEPAKLAARTHRDFTTTSPQTVIQYIKCKMDYLNEHRFFDRLLTLEHMEQPNHEHAEALDRDLQRASFHAARKCSRRKTTPWSPKLASAWAELHFYRMAYASLTTQANYQTAIQSLQNKWPHLPRAAPNSIHDIQRLRREAIQKLKQIRQEAQEARKEHLQQRADMYKAIGSHGKSKIVQRLIRAESQKQVYSKLRYLRNKDDGTQGLSKLKIPKNAPITDTETLKRLPDSPDHWEMISIPSDIERLLLARNQSHFGQAHGTPFTQPPLTASIGYKADGYAADLILSGEFEDGTIDKATQLLIKHLQTRTTTVLEGKITKEEVLGKLKNWKESTSTSPSGMHLGHYHCMWKDTKIPVDDPLHTVMKEKQEELLRCTTSLLNYAIKFGYAYERWRKVVNVMLQKDPGNPRIHRLRVIHLYEADYNLLLATKWRQAMQHAETNKLLNEGLYGSRPGRSAHDPAFIEVLQHEIYRMSMKTGINFDLDATSCYDRILASVASISSRRVGMNKKVLQVNMTNLEQSQYHLKTNLGISQQYYQHSDNQPIHGTGQGSGNSPSIWCFVCSALFDAFASAAHGALFTTYDKQTTVPMYMIGFVDDCTQRVNKFNNASQPSPNTLLQLMEEDAQLWNNLLWASGGALEQPKCSYHLIKSDWNKDGHPFISGGTLGKPIYLDHLGEKTPILQKSNYSAHKTLGCYINPAYTHVQAWITTNQKNEKFASLLETNYFTRSEAWTLYTAFYIPSMTYPLPITPLSKIQCQQLDSRWLRSLLPRCGYNRNTSRAVRYASPIHGGAGFKELYVEQGILLVQQVYKFLNSPTTTIGQLLLATISWTQAFLGTSRLFLTDVTQPIPPSGPSLLLDLRRFLQEINGSLHLQDPPVPKLLRKNDRFIMDIVMQQSRWTNRHIQQINACRRFLQAQTLADITNMFGTRIQLHAITGECGPPPSTVRVSMFNQKRPGPQAWRTWRKFLASFCNQQSVLHQPLQEWLVPASGTRHWPAAVYDREKDQLYTHLQDATYYIHSRVSDNIFNIHPTSTTTNVPGQPTATVITMGTLRPVSQPLVTVSTFHPTIPILILQSTHHVHQWEIELLQNHTELTDAQIILNSIRQGNLVLCSDGSVKNDRGSFGFVISTTEGQRLVKGHGPTPGAYPNSFRSEAYGILAAVRYLLHTTAKHPPTADTGTINHYLDNQSVITCLERMQGHSWLAPNQRLQPEQDVLDEIQYTVQLLPFKLKFKWVKGHQDSTTIETRLPLPAQLNCEADREAALQHHLPYYQKQQVTPLPSTPCQCIIQNQSVTKQLKRRIRDAITLPRLRSYLQHKFHWDEQTLYYIDWPAYEQIIKKFSESRSTIVKHLHAISPTGHIAHRNNANLPHECPACSVPFEDNDHVITCTHPTRSAWRETTIHKIMQYSKDNSDPYLLDILRDGLTRYHRKLPVLLPHHYPVAYHNLILHQNSIGWDHLYRGRWCLEWTSLQNHYTQRHHLETSEPNQPTSSWVIGLGRLLLDQWMALWKLRNEQRHGKDLARQSIIREQALRNELRLLYSYKNQVCPVDKHIFQESADSHMSNQPNLDNIETWITIHKEAIMASSTMATRLGIRQNRTLLEFPAFNPISSAGPGRPN